jgi:hypothetical protein
MLPIGELLHALAQFVWHLYRHRRRSRLRFLTHLDNIGKKNLYLSQELS